MLEATLKKLLILVIVISLSITPAMLPSDEASAEPVDDEMEDETATRGSRVAPETYAIVGEWGGRIYYYPFSGGVFGARVYLGDIGNNAQGVAVADFDGDGDYDFVYTRRSGSTLQYYIRTKNGAGASFDPATYIYGHYGYYDGQIATGDVNEDGTVDFISSGYYDTYLRVFRSNGDGTFSIKSIYMPEVRYSNGKSLVDVDMDGHLDLVIVYPSSGTTIYWLKGDGNANFGTKRIMGTTYAPAYTWGQGLAVGDFNGNGIQEVMFGVGYNNRLYTYEHLGENQFTSIVTWYNPSNSYHSIAPYDFDGDGDLDLIYSSFTVVYWLENDGTGAYSNRITLGTGHSNAFGLATPVDPAEDADSDNFPDYWEDHVGLDTSDPNEDNLDPDNDGITNRQEFDYGSNPNKKDSDGDGLDDPDEIWYWGTDPLLTDTDGDGLTDLEEVGVFQTSPNSWDWDGGGTPDNAEVHPYFNTDPATSWDDVIRQKRKNFGSTNEQPDVATDSQNNVHIAQNRFWSNGDIAYMMTDPVSNTLISETWITQRSQWQIRPQIAVDSEDKVHIIWMDFRFWSPRIAIYYIKLDPYLDDRSGNGANLNTIRVVSETLISQSFTTSNYLYHTQPRMTIDSQDRINILMPNYQLIDGFDPGLYLIQLDKNGNTLIPQKQVWPYYGQMMSPDIAVDSNDDMHVAFNNYFAALTPPNLDPVAQWHMDEGSGTVIDDESPNGNDGILGGDGLGTDLPSWTTGVKGAALDFDGSNDRVVVQNDPSIEVGKNNDDFTVEFWFYLQQGATGAWRSLIHKGGSNTQRTFAMWMQPGTTRIHYRISTNTNWNWGGDSVTQVPLNTWTHVAYVKSGSTLKLYIDGNVDHSITFTGTVNYNTGSLYIGKDPWYAGTNCIFDELAIYQGALPDSVIKNHYDSNNLFVVNTYSNRGTHYMMLDGDTGNTIIDGTQVSPNIYNGGQEIVVDSEDKVHIVWHQEDISAFYSPNTAMLNTADVTNDISLPGDGLEVEFNNQDIIAEWTTNTPPPFTNPLTLIIGARGYYSNYHVSVWDGSGWNVVTSHTMIPDGDLFSFNLNPYLPDPSGKIQVRIHHSHTGLAGMYLDLIGFQKGFWIFPVVETFYTKLDPSLDDQNGDASADGIITLIQDTRLSKRDGINSMWPTIAITDLDTLHICWFEHAIWGAKETDLVYTIMDNDGNVLTPIMFLTQPYSLWATSYYRNVYYNPTYAYIATDNMEGAHIVWLDYRNNYYYIYHAYHNPDIDGDGLPLEEELNRGTDPSNPDSDGDAIPDGVEVQRGLDPMNPDTDGDGVWDGSDIAPLDPLIGRREEEPEVHGIEIDLDVSIPGGPSIGTGVHQKPGQVPPTGLAVQQKEAEGFELTPFDWLLIIFIIMLAVALVSTMQYQKRKMESVLKARCVKGQKTTLLDMPDQIRESAEMKKAKRIRAGNLVEIMDVKGNMIEIGTEIGSFLIPADFLSCAEGVDDLDADRKEKDTDLND